MVLLYTLVIVMTTYISKGTMHYGGMGRGNTGERHYYVMRRNGF
jgi:hypothetical protein